MTNFEKVSLALAAIAIAILLLLPVVASASDAPVVEGAKNCKAVPHGSYCVSTVDGQIVASCDAGYRFVFRSLRCVSHVDRIAR